MQHPSAVGTGMEGGGREQPAMDSPLFFNGLYILFDVFYILLKLSTMSSILLSKLTKKKHISYFCCSCIYTFSKNIKSFKCLKTKQACLKLYKTRQELYFFGYLEDKLKKSITGASHETIADPSSLKIGPSTFVCRRSCNHGRLPMRFAKDVVAMP